METAPNPFSLLFIMIFMMVISVVIIIAITRWVLRINTMVQNQEKQLRTQEELVVQNEKIIRLLQRIAGDAGSTKA